MNKKIIFVICGILFCLIIAGVFILKHPYVPAPKPQSSSPLTTMSLQGGSYNLLQMQPGQYFMYPDKTIFLLYATLLSVKTTSSSNIQATIQFSSQETGKVEVVPIDILRPNLLPLFSLNLQNDPSLFTTSANIKSLLIKKANIVSTLSKYINKPVLFSFSLSSQPVNSKNQPTKTSRTINQVIQQTYSCNQGFFSSTVLAGKSLPCTPFTNRAFIYENF